MPEQKQTNERTRSHCAPIHAAVIEALESRRLLAYTVPADFEQISERSVFATQGSPQYFSAQVQPGEQYLLIARGTAKIGNRVDGKGARLTDAVKFDDFNETGQFSRAQSGRLLLSGAAGSGWGAYQTDHVYGQLVTASADSVGLTFNDQFYTDNDYAMSAELYRKIPTALTSLSVTDTTVPAPPEGREAAATVKAEGPSNVPGNVPELFVLEQDGAAKITLDAAFTTAAGGKVLWQVLGGSVSGDSSGDFGGSSSVSAVLAPGAGSRKYDVKAGIDDDGDGTLDENEIDRMVTVHVMRFDVGLLKFNTGFALTETLENTDLRRQVEVLGLPTGASATFKTRTSVTYDDSTVIHHEGDVPTSASSFTLITPTAPVPASEVDKMTPQEMSVSLTVGGRTFRSASETINVYKLWIDYFRDDATDKPWQVTVGDAIEYKAFGSDDLTDWTWDIGTGAGDKWHPTLGNAQQGNAMVIPFSDLPNVSNTDFGGTHGEVTIKVKDGNGDERMFSSTQLSGGPKTNVFFDPTKALDGNAPDVGKPPAWFVFWNQTGAGDSNVSYDHSLGKTLGETRWNIEGSTQMIIWVDTPRIGPDANSGSTLGGPSPSNHGLISGAMIDGIDTFHITVLHEMLHYDDLMTGLFAPNPDGDFLHSSLEGDLNGNGIIDPGETDPALLNTHSAITPSKPANDLEYRAYWSEVNLWAWRVGLWDSVDWSKGGKQW